MPTYAEYLAGLNASLVLALDSTNGLTDLSGNARHGVPGGFASTTSYIELVADGRKNLCVNPIFEGGFGGWTETDADSSMTPSISTTQAYDGTQSLKLVNADAGDNDYMYMTFTGLTAGQTYTFSAYVYCDSFTSGATSNRCLFISDNVATTATATLTAGTSGWERKSVTITLGASTTMTVYLYGPQGTVYYDACMVELASSAGTYFPTVAQLASNAAVIRANDYSPGPLPAGDDGATDFDGTNDRITTTYSTRRNLCPNPQFETNTTSWTPVVETHAISTDYAYDGTYSLKATFTAAGARPYLHYSANVAAAPGDVMTVSFYGLVPDTGRTGQVALRYFDAANAVLATTYSTPTAYTAGQWSRHSVTATAPANTVKVGMICYLDAGSSGVAGNVGYVDCVQIEKVATVGTYFPTTAQLASGEAGWLGTAHASASDIGCFANGTTRTFMGWAWRDNAADTEDCLIGGAVAGTSLGILSTGQVRFSPDGINYTAVSATSAWTAGQWNHWALVFNEASASNNATLYINGVAQTPATVAQQYNGLQPLLVGARNGGASGFFDGKQAWVSVHERALTPDEILDAAEFSDPTRSGSPLPRTEVRPMSLKADELLADLPPYEADSVWVQDVMDAVGREVERLDEFTEFIREGLRPQNATDQYRLLGMWETLMGLPVEPSGVSLIARQNRVTAAARRRKAGEGEGWVIAISLAIDTYAWTHSENDPGDYQLTVEMPFPSDAFNAGVLEAMLRAVTPAALQITVVYTDSFRVGISLVGDSL
jgi:hypothetical protein